MKKFLSIIAAGTLALLAFSCVKEEKAVFDATQATAPVLREAAVGDNVTVKYTPAVFNMEFNQNMKTYHTLALVSVAGQETNQTVTTKNEDNTLTLTGKNLNNLLKARGYKALDQVALTIVVRASIQDPSRGITNGYIDSKEKYDFNWTLPEESEVQGSPYEDYTEASDWSLIGAMEAYGINWDGDLNMWTDGNGNHVAAHVTLKAGDEVKFRKDQAWAVNMGGTFGSLDSEFEVSQDGPNIKVGADGVYDLFLDLNASVAWVSLAFDPYPDYTQESNWSVIGALSLAGINWDGDIAMVSDGANHAAFAVALADVDEFKFRQDKSWSVNLGGDFGELGSEFAVSQDGPNIKVGAAGVFDLFVNPDAGTATVIAAAGLKVSTKIGGDEPGPEPPVVEVTGWNVIGLNGDWENDILATESNGVWTAFITAEADTEFKWRKDAGWDDNYGGVMEAFNVPFAAEAGGANIAVPAGFYMVTLDMTNAEAPMITVFNEFTVWSLIGVNGDWNTDIDMALADGKWVSPATKISGEFKLRKNHGWDDNRGGTFGELGVPFAVENGGANINVPEGEYIVTYNPAEETVLVEAAIPSNVWSLIGVDGDWNNDIFMTELMPGVWVSPVITTTTDWKIRFNHGWDVNRGGATPSAEGVFVKAVPDGPNIGITGSFKVVYNANNETIGTLVWGVVGSIAGIPGFSWNNDVPMMLAADGKWYSIPVSLAEGDQIKIRKYAGWDDNFGGTFTEANTPFEAVAGGDNIQAVGNYSVVYDPAAGTLTLSNLYWGVVGEFSGWGNNPDVFMVPLGDGKWAAYGQTISGPWKVRQGSSWDQNRGGVFAQMDALIDAIPGGDNITVPDGSKFDIVFDAASETIFVGDVANMPAGGEAGAITIDGDMSDWADVPGAETPDAICKSMKVWNDANNFYFYVASEPGPRGSQLWGDAAGYYYFDFDLDNNPETGEYEEKNGVGGLFEAYMYLYLFGGTSSSPYIKESPNGAAKGMSIEGIVAKGVITDSLIEIELSVPMSCMPAVQTGQSITVYTKRSKDGTTISMGYVVK